MLSSLFIFGVLEGGYPPSLLEKEYYKLHIRQVSAANTAEYRVKWVFSDQISNKLQVYLQNFDNLLHS
jgi:hypothetical protein